MAPEASLPKFRRPPLIEVVHGVQFRKLAMGAVHPGLFFARLREWYPRAETVPPLAPEKEVLSGNSRTVFAFGFAPATEVPRAWFISSDDTLLVQVQADRLLVNWRRGAGNAEYPHFAQVAAEFTRVFNEFIRFAGENDLGTIEPDHCEMTYVNHLGPVGGPGGSDPVEQTVSLWSGRTAEPWTEPIEDLSFNARFLLRTDAGEAIGRLTVRLDTLRVSPDERNVLQLTITARGNPQSFDQAGVAAFHDLAHERIVRCFASITTEAAHKKWERL